MISVLSLITSGVNNESGENIDDFMLSQRIAVFLTISINYYIEINEIETHSQEKKEAGPTKFLLDN